MRSPNEPARPAKPVKDALRQPEPTLDELLQEPIICLMMRRDGILPEAIRLDLHRLGGAVSLAEPV